jgi:hypothetical protein
MMMTFRGGLLSQQQRPGIYWRTDTDWGACRVADTLTVLPASAIATIPAPSKEKSVLRIQGGRPDVKVLIVKAYVCGGQSENTLKLESDDRIRKPSGLKEIGAKVHEILAG